MRSRGRTAAGLKRQISSYGRKAYLNCGYSGGGGGEVFGDLPPPPQRQNAWRAGLDRANKTSLPGLAILPQLRVFIPPFFISLPSTSLSPMQLIPPALIASSFPLVLKACCYYCPPFYFILSLHPTLTLRSGSSMCRSL